MRVYLISIDDLEKFAQNNFAVKNRLKLVKLRIKAKQVGDIDYFKYPKRFLETTVEKMSQKDIDQYRTKQIQAKERMIKCILRYAYNFKKGRVMFPPALTALSKIRKDR